MTMVKVVMRLQDASGLPANQFMNTFYVDDSKAPSGYMTYFENFYNLRQTGAVNAVAYYLASYVARGPTAGQYSLYAFKTDPSLPLGPPFGTGTFSMPASSGSSDFPSEVAGTVSYHADYTGVPEHAGKSRPRARYRGRAFVGPLNNNAFTTDGTPPRCHLSGNYTNDVASAFHTLVTGLTGGLQVYSRVDHVFRPVVAAWVDDAADTQRRRGIPAVNRVSWG